LSPAVSAHTGGQHERCPKPNSTRSWRRLIRRFCNTTGYACATPAGDSSTARRSDDANAQAIGAFPRAKKDRGARGIPVAECDLPAGRKVYYVRTDPDSRKESREVPSVEIRKVGQEIADYLKQEAAKGASRLKLKI